jgi:hypothetical protein
MAKQYEIVMYKLLIIVLVGIFVAISLGFFAGHAFGVASADVETPEYCYSKAIGGKIVVECNELSDTTVADLCKLFSEEIEQKTRVVLIN